MDAVPDTLYEFETIFQASYPDDFDTVWKHIGTKAAIGFHQPEPNHFVTEYPGHTKMYEAVTQYCGFPAIEAGKLMGLAPYGKPNDELPSFFNGEWYQCNEFGTQTSYERSYEQNPHKHLHQSSLV